MRNASGEPWTYREQLDLLVRAAEARIVAVELVIEGRRRRAINGTLHGRSATDPSAKRP